MVRESAGAYAALCGATGGRSDRLVPPTLPEGREHVFHLYVARCEDRDGLRQFLADRKIASGVHYPISLPLFPEMTTEEQDRVVDAVLEWLD